MDTRIIKSTLKVIFTSNCGAIYALSTDASGILVYDQCTRNSKRLYSCLGVYGYTVRNYETFTNSAQPYCYIRIKDTYNWLNNRHYFCWAKSETQIRVIRQETGGMNSYQGILTARCCSSSVTIFLLNSKYYISHCYRLT